MDAGERAVREASQCPQNVEDVLGQKAALPHLSVLEIFEVCDKGRAYTEDKIRVADYPTPISGSLIWYRCYPHWFLRLQVKENR